MRWHHDFKRLLTRTFLLLAAAACLSATFVLVLHAGLPARAAFTGQLLPGGLVAAPEIGALAPPIEGTTPDGQTRRLADWRGRPVIVNFWATWCGPCRAEMPQFQALYDRYQSRGLHILAINLGETAAAVQNWTRALGLTFDIVLDPDGETAARYQLRGQPSTYIISPTGTITHIFYGPATFEILQAAIAPFVTAER